MKIHRFGAGTLRVLTLALWAQAQFSAGAADAAGGKEYAFTTWASVSRGRGAEDGPGAAARFFQPAGVAVDQAGNLYVADTANHTIRKVTPAGGVLTVAGLAGAQGSTDAKGCFARFAWPQGVAVDALGNLFVADTGNHTIRKITPKGVVTTLAGLAGQSGSADGTNSAARFYHPTGVALDAAANVYVADAYNDTIRKITPAGKVTTFAGTAGVDGSANGTGPAASFSEPSGIAIDSAGNLYVADTGNGTIRKITPGRVVSNWAGKAGVYGSADGTGGTASFGRPMGLAVDSLGAVYVADTDNCTVRKISPARAVSTLAGVAQSAGSLEGTGRAARFGEPNGVAVDSTGTVYVADLSNHAIRKITSAGLVSTLAGGAEPQGYANGTTSAARFSAPHALARDALGFLYVADTDNSVIRKITPTGLVSTLAGLAGEGHNGSADGTNSAARFNHPQGLTTDTHGTVYVADTFNHTIRKVTRDGVVTTVAGLAGQSGTADLIGSDARFWKPTGLAADAWGNLYVADYGNNTIRKISPAGAVSTLAGCPGKPGAADGMGTNALFNGPQGLALDSAANVYVADTWNHTIRKVTPAGEVSTLAGVAQTSGAVDGTRRDARFYGPFALAIDGAGNLFVADTWNQLIRLVSPQGQVTTIGGSPDRVGSSDGIGSDAGFSNPSGLATDGSTNVYVADTLNHTIRLGRVARWDSAVIDAAEGPAGEAHQLDTVPQTARSWSWKLARRPAASVARFSSATIRNPTFTPDVADLFVFELRAVDASGVAAISRVSFNAQPLVLLPLTLQYSGPSKITGATNHQALVVGYTYTFTAVPAAGFAFGGWTNGEGQVLSTKRALSLDMQTNLVLGATFIDTQQPTISLAYPLNGGRVKGTSALVTVRGTVKDNDAGAKVWCQINGLDWTQAVVTQGTNWSATVPMLAGTNLLIAYAQDKAGLWSKTLAASFQYVVPSRFTLTWLGKGTFAGPTNGQALEINRGYTLTATPATGFVFGNWITGDGVVLTNRRVLNFVMRTNYALTATFLDTQAPALTIRYPVPNAGLAASTNFVSVRSSATDNDAVATVWCQINGGGWVPATRTGPTNWSAVLPVTAGTSTARAYAQDRAGLCSKTNAVTFQFTPTGGAREQQFAFALAGKVQAVLPDGTLEVFFGDAARALTAEEAARCQAQASSNLVNWEPLTENLNLTNGQLRLRAPAASSERFYRLWVR